MKIERINDHQFRCMLTQKELSDRKINLSELAYGSEKARSLFHDLMEQAFAEFGFEAEDIPVMIEAIPMSEETIMLIVTKIEDPEELDTRFSRFTPSASEDEDNSGAQRADDILELFRLLSEAKSSTQKKEKEKQSPAEPSAFVRIYSFPDLDSVCRAAAVLNCFFHGESSLYQDPKEKVYYLSVRKSEETPEDFNKVCNILSEYGTRKGYSAASEAYFMEHFRPVIQKDAVSKLALI